MGCPFYGPLAGMARRVLHGILLNIFYLHFIGAELQSSEGERQGQTERECCNARPRSDCDVSRIPSNTVCLP